ncbi:hypothetical protein BGX29_009369, partial [Mortierella sp. GBA35]
ADAALSNLNNQQCRSSVYGGAGTIDQYGRRSGPSRDNNNGAGSGGGGRGGYY